VTICRFRNRYQTSKGFFQTMLPVPPIWKSPDGDAGFSVSTAVNQATRFASPTAQAFYVAVNAAAIPAFCLAL